MSNNIGTVIISRHGDRIHYFQDPKNYKGFFTKITPLGLAESNQLGRDLRSIYVNPRSRSHIQGIRADLAGNKQIQVLSKNGGEGNVVFDSAIALLQGLYPPSSRNRITLANGTTIVAPLSGYQYIAVETVEPKNDRALEPWTNCPNFQRHIREFYNSDEFKEVARDNEEFLDSLKPFVFGRPTKLENAWNIYDFINTQFTYNQTYARRLPPHVLERIRSLADFHENGVFSDKRPSGIGNIAGRSLMALVLDALERMGFSDDPLKFTLIETGYQPFISFFHEIEAVKEDPELEAIPEFSSAIALELHETHPPDVRTTLRLKFKNGTEEDFRTIHAYGHRGDIPLTEFISRARPGAIENNKEWARVCGVRGRWDVATVLADSTASAMPSPFLIIPLILLAVFFVFWRRKTASALHPVSVISPPEKNKVVEEVTEH
ncbi:phosphoglycerate mutase-like protein [Moniliophthora roreri]|uniref:Phosphoglycerate mutase-like protein n=1 Tax=Moniliophthora roreri TaxID=221103 RepID=A0A0W0F0G1_MONRR|nr:phosphoglycerate mutase-like protein [Moniliophthora roreri]